MKDYSELNLYLESQEIAPIRQIRAGIWEKRGKTPPHPSERSVQKYSSISIDKEDTFIHASYWSEAFCTLLKNSETFKDLDPTKQKKLFTLHHQAWEKLHATINAIKSNGHFEIGIHGNRQQSDEARNAALMVAAKAGADFKKCLEELTVLATSEEGHLQLDNSDKAREKWLHKQKKLLKHANKELFWMRDFIVRLETAKTDIVVNTPDKQDAEKIASKTIAESLPVVAKDMGLSDEEIAAYYSAELEKFPAAKAFYQAKRDDIHRAGNLPMKRPVIPGPATFLRQTHIVYDEKGAIKHKFNLGTRTGLLFPHGAANFGAQFWFWLMGPTFGKTKKVKKGFKVALANTHMATSDTTLHDAMVRHMDTFDALHPDDKPIDLFIHRGTIIDEATPNSNVWLPIEGEAWKKRQKELNQYRYYVQGKDQLFRVKNGVIEKFNAGENNWFLDDFDERQSHREVRFKLTRTNNCQTIMDKVSFERWENWENSNQLVGSVASLLALAKGRPEIWQGLDKISGDVTKVHPIDQQAIDIVLKFLNRSNVSLFESTLSLSSTEQAAFDHVLKRLKTGSPGTQQRRDALSLRLQAAVNLKIVNHKSFFGAARLAINNIARAARHVPVLGTLLFHAVQFTTWVSARLLQPLVFLLRALVLAPVVWTAKLVAGALKWLLTPWLFTPSPFDRVVPSVPPIYKQFSQELYRFLGGIPGLRAYFEGVPGETQSKSQYEAMIVSLLITGCKSALDRYGALVTLLIAQYDQFAATGKITSHNAWPSEKRENVLKYCHPRFQYAVAQEKTTSPFTAPQQQSMMSPMGAMVVGNRDNPDLSIVTAINENRRKGSSYNPTSMTSAIKTNIKGMDWRWLLFGFLVGAAIAVGLMFIPGGQIVGFIALKMMITAALSNTALAGAATIIGKTLAAMTVAVITGLVGAIVVPLLTRVAGGAAYDVSRAKKFMQMEEGAIAAGNAVQCGLDGLDYDQAPEIKEKPGQFERLYASPSSKHSSAVVPSYSPPSRSHSHLGTPSLSESMKEGLWGSKGRNRSDSLVSLDSGSEVDEEYDSDGQEPKEKRGPEIPA